MDQVRELIARFDGPGFRSREDRATAIEELQNLGVAGQQCLLQLFGDSDPETRVQAAAAIIMTYGLSGQPLLLPLLHDADDVVRWYVCGLLYDFGDAGAVPALAERLRTDPSVSVRVIAADAVGRIASRGSAIPSFAISALEETAERDHEYNLLGFSPSGQAQEALAIIRGEVEG